MTPEATGTQCIKITTNGWHHLVVTAAARGNRQDAVIYVDGMAVASGKTTRTGDSPSCAIPTSSARGCTPSSATSAANVCALGRGWPTTQRIN